MPRELSTSEIQSFLGRHADIAVAVDRIERGNGYTSLPLVYPLAGVAVKEPSGGYVLVWRDASRRWHYIDLSGLPAGDSLANQTNKPEFVSDPQYLELIQSQLARAFNLTLSGLEWVPWVVGGLVAYEVLKRR